MTYYLTLSYRQCRPGSILSGTLVIQFPSTSCHAAWLAHAVIHLSLDLHLICDFGSKE